MTILRHLLRLGAIVAVVAFCTSQGGTQEQEKPDPSLKPEYGTIDLKAGFANDPRVVRVTAGGAIETRLGGVKAYVAKAPDFRLNYTAGAFALTIYAESKADTTLLINLPTAPGSPTTIRAAT
jgi:hypothetical protein